MATTEKSRAREWWKAIYRKMRIAKREIIKADIDLAMYGNSVVFVDEQGEAKHIPWENMKWQPLN